MKNSKRKESKKVLRFQKTKKEKGITLIALVITIIVLLILAGVTIATLTGNNGILTKATEAKDKTEEGEEEEKVKLSAVGALAKDNGGKIKEGYLEEELSSQFGEKGTDYNLEGSGPFTVTIIESGRSYLINEDGTLGEVVEREGIKVGDYVNYTYDAVTDGYPLTQTESGYTSDQTVVQTNGFKWRILNIDPSGRVDLISDTPTSQTVYFGGARGYNNGVLLINDICKSLYGNSNLGVTARSLDLKDIEDKMNVTGIAARDAYTNSSSGTRYGNTKTYGSGYNQYPNLYAQENGSGINTEEVKRDGIDVNADGYSSPTTEDSNTANEGLTVTQTYYYFSNTPSNYFDDQEFYNMVFGTGSYYWLASRYATCDSSYVPFGLCFVETTGISGNGMFNSDGITRINYSHLRPVVSLGADIQITPVENADGSTPSNMHQISKK